MSFSFSKESMAGWVFVVEFCSFFFFFFFLVPVQGQDDVGHLQGPNPDDPNPVWDYREFSGELDIASDSPWHQLTLQTTIKY